MKKTLSFTILVALLFFNSCFFPGVSKENDTKKLPVDPKVKIGKLENGLTYYIRKNSKPENRLALNLVVSAGAINEDENQRGLAHLCEHMAFNGTEHFHKQELVNYLESIGMKFGAELNAYTSFDQTVYMLNLPTDNDTIMEKGFQVLDDWASNVSYDNEEIDKERGVVHEEWRGGRGAGQRIRDKFLPILFYGSKYGERLPIGLMDVVDNCSYETLKSFYKDWYRPDLQAVVAVGDYEVEEIEKLIIEYFEDNENPNNERKKEEVTVPDHKDTKYVIATDKEMTRTTIYLYTKHDKEDKSTVDWYRRNLTENLFSKMLNSRYQELVQQADPPFIGAFAGDATIIDVKPMYMFAALVKETDVEKGMKTLLTEVKRVENHGFLKSELERTKKQILRGFQSAYNEREKTNSDRYINEYSNNFLTNEAIPGIEWEWEHVQKILPNISIDEVNQLAKQLATDENRVVIVSGPEKEGLVYPTEKELDAIVQSVKTTEVEAYEENVADVPLLPGVLKPGMIVSNKHFDETDINEFELSNGIKVYYKVTDFKDDEILMSAFSPGGHSLSSDKDFISASYSSGIIDASGVGEFDIVSLRKKLAGKKVSASPYIVDLKEGFTGSSSVEDFETMLQLINLYFTHPRKDETAFQSILSRQISLLENRKADPRSALQDTITSILTQKHFRSRPMTAEILQAELNLDKSYEFYKDRFADADDFTFFFVGNINPEMLKTLCMKYLGSLPSLPRVDQWKDINEDYPEGKIEKELYVGVDQKSTVALVYNGKEDWTLENQKKIGVTKDILNIMLREKIREEESGTYGVRCSAILRHYPESEYRFFIKYGCDPDRAKTLTDYIFDEIEKLKTDGPSDENMSKVKTTLSRSYEKNLENNRYWLGKMNYYISNDLNIDELSQEAKIIESLTKEDIQKAAQKYFGDNLVEVIQYPAE